MAVRMGIFNGANVFLSRNLVPAEMYDALHDALRLNGAQVFLCCDPSRNSQNDYHVISSLDHEKFEDLKAKGCNLIGPHCILSCAKERRNLLKQGYTCCLAMDGVKILTSGFEKDERVKIEQLVTAMGGVLHSKSTLDVSFVIVKNVLAAKYKWALNVLKKPIVNMSWLNQCWIEHRLVPQESYRILPFTGLTICVTRIPSDERKEIEQLILQNGGKYSGDLTKTCTHLVSDAPEGDKYKVAKRWGNIHIVTRRWIDQSVARKASLDEGHYPVHGSYISNGDIKSVLKEQHSQDWSNTTSQSIPSNVPGDLETSLSQKISSTFSDATTAVNDSSEIPNIPIKDEANFENRVAEDSEDEGNDLYLSNCRIFLLGFEEMELRRLVSMIRKGGGTRHMLLSEKLTHIIAGSPSEIERKEVRRLAAWGVIYMVNTLWLEDCDRSKKEVPVSQRHIVSDLLLPKDPTCFSKLPLSGVADIKKGKGFPTLPRAQMSQSLEDKNSEEGYAFGKLRGRETFEFNLQESIFSDLTAKSKQKSHLCSVSMEGNGSGNLNCNSNKLEVERNSSNIFKGHSFCFSSSFPGERRADIIEWVKQGGGLMVKDNQIARFIIECHGVTQNHADASRSTTVSSHWIRSCLEEGCIQDVASHILYTPLCCRIPLPGFESLRFCISQYEMKERQLLRNLCFTLGSKCSEKLSRKITHLLCKFTSGPKYEAACNWGIQSVTADWITECIRQDRVVLPDQFQPKAVTARDREAGFCTTSQYPTQAVGLISEEAPSQLLTGSHRPITTMKHKTEYSSIVNKRLRISENDYPDDLSSKTIVVEDLPEASNTVPDVAAAIEDLLEQSNKIKDQKLPRGNSCKRSDFSPDHSILDRDHADSRSTFRISEHWSERTEKPLNLSNLSGRNGSSRAFDAFSETQTESQVVGYEEDLTGRQKIIDRVRSQSLGLTPDRQ